MPSKILDGKVLAQLAEEDIKASVSKLKENGITPTLATILVGVDPASATYVKMKQNACARLGMDSIAVELSKETSTEELLEAIERLNQDSKVHGILLQHPVPSQINEMRILADLADVKELKKAFKNNEDIHSLTASEVFNIDIKKVDQDMRRKAKAINFGIIYGISQYGLAKQIMVSNNEAEEFLNSYFLKFPEIKAYMEATIKFCRKSGYVNNIFGRRSHITGINDKNYNVRNFQERAAINAPIQGSASEIMRLAMIRLDKSFNNLNNIKSKILLQIHDELIFEVPNNEVKNISKIIKDEMTSVTESDLHSFSTPLTVDINIGENWGILH